MAMTCVRALLGAVLFAVGVLVGLVLSDGDQVFITSASLSTRGMDTSAHSGDVATPSALPNTVNSQRPLCELPPKREALSEHLGKLCMGASYQRFPEPSGDGKWPRIPRVLHYSAKQRKPVAERLWEQSGLVVAYHNDEAITVFMREMEPEIFQHVFPVLDRIEQVDVFRYALMRHCGGFYADQDALPQRHVDQWLETFDLQQNASSAEFVIGLEFSWAPEGDDAKNSPVLAVGGALPLQFCQWTFAFARNSALIGSVLDTILRFAGRLASGNPVMRTGPGMFTGAILRFLAEQCGHREWNKLYPTCLLPIVELEKKGHVLSYEHDNHTHTGVFLPYRAFGFHPWHGHASRQLPLQDHLVVHGFEGSWRTLRKIMMF